MEKPITVTKVDKIQGVFKTSRPEFKDSRGSLVRVFSQAEAAIDNRQIIKQSLISKNKSAATLRGFHWQKEPYSEAKWLYPLSGSFFIAILDLRQANDLIFLLQNCQINSSQSDAIYIPEYCATAYLTLEDHSDVLYHLFNDFNPAFATGIVWNDPDINCEWPIMPKEISDKDSKLLSLRQMFAK